MNRHTRYRPATTTRNPGKTGAVTTVVPLNGHELNIIAKESVESRHTRYRPGPLPHFAGGWEASKDCPLSLNHPPTLPNLYIKKKSQRPSPRRACAREAWQGMPQLLMFGTGGCASCWVGLMNFNRLRRDEFTARICLRPPLCVSTGLGVAFCLNVNSQLGFAETDDRLVDPSRSCTTLCRLEASP